TNNLSPMLWLLTCTKFFSLKTIGDVTLPSESYFDGSPFDKKRFLCSPASRLGRRPRRRPFLLSFVQDALKILDDLFGLLRLRQLGASSTFRGHTTVGIISPRPPGAAPRRRTRTASPSAWRA